MTYIELQPGDRITWANGITDIVRTCLDRKQFRDGSCGEFFFRWSRNESDEPGSWGYNGGSIQPNHQVAGTVVRKGKCIHLGEKSMDPPREVDMFLRETPKGGFPADYLAELGGGDPQ